VKLGWFDKNGEGRTHPVGGLAPNQWGLYDMHGDVFEWYQDWQGAHAADDQVDRTGTASGREFGAGWSGREQGHPQRCPSKGADGQGPLNPAGAGLSGAESL